MFIDLLFYKQIPGLNIPLASLAFLGATYLGMYIGGHRLPVRAHIAAIFSFLFAVPFAIGTSEQMLMLSTLGVLSAHLLFAGFAVGHEARFNHPLEILWSGTAALGVKLLGRLDFFGKMKPPALSQTHWAVVKGAAVLLPLLVIFMALFASADPVFNSYFGDIGDWLSTWTNPGDIVTQLLLIGILFVVLAPFWQRQPSTALRTKLVLSATRAGWWKARSSSVASLFSSASSLSCRLRSCLAAQWPLRRST